MAMHQMTKQSDDDLIAIGEAARLIGVSTRTVERYVASGKIPTTRTPGGQKRFRRSDLAAYLTPVAPRDAA